MFIVPFALKGDDILQHNSNNKNDLANYGKQYKLARL